MGWSATKSVKNGAPMLGRARHPCTQAAMGGAFPSSSVHNKNVFHLSIINVFLSERFSKTFKGLSHVQI